MAGTPSSDPHFSASRPPSDSKASVGGVRSFDRIAIRASSWASQSMALAAKITFWLLACANWSSRKSASPTAMMRPRERVPAPPADGSIATASVWIPTSSAVAPIGKLGSAIIPGGRVPPDSVVVHSAVTAGSPSSQVKGAAQPKVALPRSRLVG